MKKKILREVLIIPVFVQTFLWAKNSKRFIQGTSKKNLQRGDISQSLLYDGTVWLICFCVCNSVWCNIQIVQFNTVEKYNPTNQTNESARLSKNIYVHEKTLEVYWLPAFNISN